MLRTVRQHLMQEMIEYVCEHEEEIRESSSDPSVSNFRLQDLDGRVLATLNAVCRAESIIAPVPGADQRPPRTRVFVIRVETEDLLETKINKLLEKMYPAEVIDVKIEKQPGEDDGFLVCVLYNKAD
ncbi:MAG: hypothetical protein E3J72_01395 [Planctomycetota bacterium]|nr:MAG: hypothetical protein E3J72_01395 [Planctomycetota bacterium]